MTEENKRLRFAVMGSTQGSSFAPVIEAWQRHEIACDPVLVISNRKQSGILQKAQEAGIETLFLPVGNHDRLVYDGLVSEALKTRSIDFILLIGYMRILSGYFVKQWNHRIFNVHPSLLPKYGGMMDMEIHEAVINAGDKETGCSVHIVTEEVDGGPVVIQKRVEVLPCEKADALKKRVQILEGEAFLEILKNPSSYLR